MAGFIVLLCFASSALAAGQVRFIVPDFWWNEPPAVAAPPDPLPHQVPLAARTGCICEIDRTRDPLPICDAGRRCRRWRRNVIQPPSACDFCGLPIVDDLDVPVRCACRDDDEVDDDSDSEGDEGDEVAAPEENTEQGYIADGTSNDEEGDEGDEVAAPEENTEQGYIADGTSNDEDDEMVGELQGYIADGACDLCGLPLVDDLDVPVRCACMIMNDLDDDDEVDDDSDSDSDSDSDFFFSAR
jgi:hypothetical protein